GASTHAHPAGSKGRYGIGKLARPRLLHGARRADDDGAAEIFSIVEQRGADLAEVDTARPIELCETRDGAVHVDRLAVAGIVQERHEPLCLAERIGADEMGALGEELDAFQKLCHFVFGWLMAEDREPER